MYHNQAPRPLLATQNDRHKQQCQQHRAENDAAWEFPVRIQLIGKSRSTTITALAQAAID